MIFEILLVYIVAFEALAIMLVEFFASPEKISKVFGLSLNYTKMPEAQIAMKNQGLYNGFLGAGLLISQGLVSQASLTWMFVTFVLIAAIFGWATTKNIKVLLVQGLPAALCLLAMAIFGA